MENTLVDHKTSGATVEPVTPKYVPIVRTQEVVINDKGAYVFGVESLPMEEQTSCKPVLKSADPWDSGNPTSSRRARWR